jgi:hypothetical protein
LRFAVGCAAADGREDEDDDATDFATGFEAEEVAKEGRFAFSNGTEASAQQIADARLLWYSLPEGESDESSMA